jgi:hypothetical protein
MHRSDCPSLTRSRPSSTSASRPPKPRPMFARTDSWGCGYIPRKTFDLRRYAPWSPKSDLAPSLTRRVARRAQTSRVPGTQDQSQNLAGCYRLLPRSRLIVSGTGMRRTS